MTFSVANAQAAADILVARRIGGESGPRLPENCRPQNIDDALAIQAAVTEQWCAQMDDSIGGWKCLQPSADKIIVAPIYTRTINSVPPVALWPKGELARIEPELAFFFGADLPARAQPYSASEVDAAIARTHMALELIGGRYDDPANATFPEMLADGLVNQGLFIGPQVDSARAQTASEIAIQVTCDGAETRVHQGRHPNTHPRAPLYWLAEFLRSCGLGIEAGQAVITGSYAGVLEVPLNTAVTIEYPDLGLLEVSFTAKAPHQ